MTLTADNIISEIINNTHYTATGAKFILRSHQKQLVNSFFGEEIYVLIKARQIGSTTTAMIYIACLAKLKQNSDILVIVNCIESFLNLIEQYMETNSIEYSKKRSTLLLPNNSKISVRNAEDKTLLKGCKYDLVVMDELAWFNDIKGIFNKATVNASQIIAYTSVPKQQSEQAQVKQCFEDLNLSPIVLNYTVREGWNLFKRDTIKAIGQKSFAQEHECEFTY